MKRIYFDMDGTIANFYEVEGWLESILNEDTNPYEKAEPMVSEKVMITLQENGYELNIISWLAKNGSENYNKAVRKAKRQWLKINYPNVKFNEVHIVKYGTPKSRVAKHKEGILFDDEIGNRIEWKGIAYEPKKIYEI